MVAVMRYAVVTQACPARSLRSSAITRIALATIVWSRAARNIPIIRPMRIVTISLWESGIGSAVRGGPAVASDMSLLLGGVEGEDGKGLAARPQVRVERVPE